MLQQATGVDPLVILNNASLPRVDAEFMQARARSRCVYDLPIDCANTVLSFMHVIELCSLKSTSRGFKRMAEVSLKLPRAISHRRNIDEKPVDWLHRMRANCAVITRVDVHDIGKVVSEAAYALDLSAIRVLLNDSRIAPFVNRARGCGPTMCFVAASQGNTDVVRRLLEFPNLDPNVRVTYTTELLAPIPGTHTALHVSVAEGHTEVVKLLLNDARCDVCAKVVPHVPKEHYLCTPMHLAVFYRHLNIVTELLGNSLVDPNQCNRDGKTALGLCLRAPYDCSLVEVVRELSKCNRVDVNARAPRKRAPICGIARYNLRTLESSHREQSPLSSESVQCARACFDLLMGRPELSIPGNILRYAAASGDPHMLTALLRDQRVDPREDLGDGASALHYVFESYPEYWKPCIDVIRKDGRIDVNSTDSKGRTALHIVCGTGRYAAMLRHDALVALLQFSNIELNALTDDRQTPLHLLARTSANAADACNVQRTAFLNDLHSIAKGRLNVGAMDKFNTTVLQYACTHSRGDPTFLRRLIELFATTSKDHDGNHCSLLAVNAKSTTGLSALHMVTYAPEQNLVAELLCVPNIDVNIRNSHGDSPLHYASKHRRPRDLRALLGVPGILVNAMNHDGETALLQAVEKQFAEGVKLLLGVPGIDFYTKNCYNLSWTPLQTALKCECDEIIELLMEAHGVEIDIGEMFLSVVASGRNIKEHPKVAAVLEKERDAHAKCCDNPASISSSLELSGQSPLLRVHAHP